MFLFEICEFFLLWHLSKHFSAVPLSFKSIPWLRRFIYLYIPSKLGWVASCTDTHASDTEAVTANSNHRSFDLYEEVITPTTTTTHKRWKERKKNYLKNRLFSHFSWYIQYLHIRTRRLVTAHWIICIIFFFIISHWYKRHTKSKQIDSP